MTTSAAVPSRKERRRQATVAEILDAARSQIRRDGVAALNLNDVARQVGLRPPSLYEYFPGGKYDIYDALFREGFTLFATYMRPPLTYASIEEQLRHSLDSYLRFAVDYPELFQLCFERPVPGFVPSYESMRVSLDLLEEARGILRELVLIRNNALKLGADQVVDLGIALMHGIAALHVANEPSLPVGEGRFGSLIPAATAVLIRALAPPPVDTTEGDEP